MNNKLTIKQAAALTGYSEGHLRRLCKEERIEAEMFGYNWAIDRDSLLKFVREQKSKGGHSGPQ